MIGNRKKNELENWKRNRQKKRKKNLIGKELRIIIIIIIMIMIGKRKKKLIGKELRITPWFVPHTKYVVRCAYDYG